MTVWQKNRPLREITFEGITAENISMPLNDYGDPAETVDITLKDSLISFTENADCVIRGGNFGVISAENLEIKNLCAPFVKVYGKVGEIKAENLSGVTELYTVTEEEFEADPI